MKPLYEDKNKRPGTIGYLIAVFIFATPLIIGVLFIWTSSYRIYKQSQASQWIETPGIVLNSEVIRTQSSGGKNKTSKTHYRAVVEYEYSVGSRSYQSNWYYAGSKGLSVSSIGEAQNVVNSHPSGKKLVVYYNPENPAQACLVKGFENKLWLFLVLGLGATCLGMFFLYRYITRVLFTPNIQQG